MAPEARTLSDIPAWDGAGEMFQTLHAASGTTIERIVSRGHTTDWYDLDHDEWVMVHEGAAVLELDGGRTVRLDAGQHILLPAHCRHRVVWTAPDAATIWVAVHLPPRGTG